MHTNPIQHERGTCTIDHCPRDPRHGTICQPCRQRLRDQLDELDQLWLLLPDELLTGRGTLRLDALDLMSPVPSVHSRRLAAGTVADTRLPRYWTTVKVIIDPATGEALGRTWDRMPALLPDGSQDTYAAGDQHGALPLTIWLDQWVLAWRDQRGSTERLPVPTVLRLTGWLRARIDWAADTRGAAIDDLAAELGEQVAMLRRVTHMTPVRLAACCPSCDLRALVRWPGSRWDECRFCRRLVTRREYDDLADGELAALSQEGAARRATETTVASRLAM